jgi:hypothetical protein
MSNMRSKVKQMSSMAKRPQAPVRGSQSAPSMEQLNAAKQATPATKLGGIGGMESKAVAAKAAQAAKAAAKAGSKNPTQADMERFNAARQATNLGNQKTAYQMSTQKQMQDAAMKQQPNQKSPLAGKNIGDLRKIGTGLGAFGKKPGMKAGGDVKHSDMVKDKPMMKKVAAKAVKGHEKKMHGMAKGGGIEVRGKTKGTMVKMKRGGSC